MKIIAVSDLHGHLPEIPPCDLLLIAGDICGTWSHTISAQAEFLEEDFRTWLENVPAKNVVGVAGNHDFIFEKAVPLVPMGLRWHYLFDSEITIDGLRIYGTPWQPWYLDWAFNLYEPELEKKWELIPEGIDILVCHGPPHGYGDRTDHGERTGSPSLLSAIQRIQPRLCVFGHIHEGRGAWTLPAARQSGIQLANVAIRNRRYEPVHSPMLFEL